MKRSVALRNFIGSFLGGVVGILVSWYLAPMLLPLGVLLGVIIGWWAEDIVDAGKHSYRFASQRWKKFTNSVVLESIQLPSCSGFLMTTRAIIVLLITKTRNSVLCAVEYVSMPFKWILRGLRSLARFPVHFTQWASHPASKAVLISYGVVVVGIALNAVIFYTFYPWPEVKMIGGGVYGKPEQIVSFALSDKYLFTLLATLVLTVFGTASFLRNSYMNPVQLFYSRWERYARHAPFTYFVVELYRFFRAEVVMVAYITLSLLYWVTLGGALLAIVTIPAITSVTFMVSLWKIAQRSAHWWCFVVTLVVTTTSAIMFYDKFNNELILWLVALCTGLVSGIVSESLRRFGLWWGDTKTGEKYLMVWYDFNSFLPAAFANTTWRLLWQTYESVGQKIIVRIS